MPTVSSRRHRALVGAVLAALVAYLLLVAPAPAAPAAPDGPAAQKASVGKVRGSIFGRAGGAPPRLRLLLFRGDWTYLGARNVSGSTYSLSLGPGSYRLQFVDRRPAYDVSKYAPTDAFVRVRAGRTTVKNVRMRAGAVITGTVRTGGKPGARARVVAANPSEQSFETVANERGEFALGGLPAGSYSLFTYDRRRTWVGKSTYVPKLAARTPAHVRIALNRKGGELRVDLYAGGEPLRGSGYATAVSRRSGQFWTVRFSGGSVAFPGVFPGRYKLVMPGVGRWFGRTGAVTNGNVRPGRGAFGSFRLTQRGGAFVGQVVRGDGGAAIQGARVRLYDRAGQLLHETTTSQTGAFLSGGQLRAQSALRLVIDHPYDPNYQTQVIADLDIAANQDRALGTIALPRVE
ncbi:carboxypeptidase-like regulatory domain-containing protein [Nocardioides sp. cx-173]|uniref:carboxypeptidase-like regulatory domain-containing protein n=1 Tax=Nocardioides sp. cx-173 TaxID=2898796 RepID=UPI001E5C1A18|nr:carboxypeptidase-like regulatory domain-containing protein [Nocardioides sp. cx-173]MCD4525619.1 carboxypeptidase-like regulatory domain-containing protein [Nocardioides sp. cx-173]UGB42760.1 carboxypeptidase-like regulatory domain-containing protein [Nocardioides sp. cx-173]